MNLYDFPPPPPREDVKCDLLPGQLDMVANILRTIYENIRSGYMGRPYKVDLKKHPIKLWREIAQTCVSFKADPGYYMEFLFKKARDPANLYPNVIAGDWAKSAWIKAHPTVSTKFSEKEIQEININAEEELLLAVRLTTELIKKTTGETDIASEKALQILRAFCTHIPPYIRCLLGYPDERIMKTYAQEAKKFLIVRATVRDAAKKHGLPVDEVLIHASR